MNNPKRNSPCLCGSGKKYNNCCGISNIINISPQLYNDELDQLHDDLLTYALGNYEEEFMDQAAAYFQPFLRKSTFATESYITGLTLWTILNVPLLRNDQTIFDAFSQQQKGNIKRTRTKNTFLEWANTVPSVYEVLATDNVETHMATIIELSTKKEFQVPMIDKDEYIEGSIIIGALIPFVGFHHFFFDVIEIFGVHKRKITSLIRDFSDGEHQLRETFPSFLAEVLLIDEDNEVDHSLGNLVIDLFSKHMSDKGFDDEVIDLGIGIWQTYLLTIEPTFKKAATYAAALEYLVQTLVVENNQITQKQIAEEYGITAGTVSTNYRKLLNFMDDIVEKSHFHANSYESVHMEKDMRKITRILSDKDFDSTEEKNAMPPRDIAQDLLYDARDALGVKRKKLIEEALEIYPNSPDAYLLLAEMANSELTFGKNLQKAVQVGEKDLGKAFFLKNKGNFWMMIETRPYMRAKAMYADFLYETGNDERASEQYEEMIRLNPNDNQGIRYILLTLYIETTRFKKAQELINHFSDESTASFIFNKVLVDYSINGFTNQTKTLIIEANKQNPFVRDYLLGKKKVPIDYLDQMGFGDETEAIVYAQENMHLWNACPELLKEL
jgi:tetratricopeptide (TPR) repeat protein